MPDILGTGLALPGLSLLMLTAGLAGIVYGFAGFGAALVFMPLAAALLGPLAAVAAFQVTAIASLFSVLPQAWHEADRRAALIMVGAAVLAAPLGIWLLRTGDPVWLRWAVSLIVLGTLLALMTGWRIARAPGPRAWAGVGAGVGFLGGSVGLNGPALILFQLAGPDGAVRSRANTIVVLTLSSVTILPLMAVQGALPASAVTVGALLFLPYLAGSWAGRRLFTPAREALYRRAAYVVIAAAGVLGLPIWT